MEPVHPGYLLLQGYPMNKSDPRIDLWDHSSLLYVNDIPNIPFSKDSYLITYVDDLLLFKPISSQKDLFNVM